MGGAKVIRTLRDELEMTMALTGVANLKALTPMSLFFKVCSVLMI